MPSNYKSNLDLFHAYHTGKLLFPLYREHPKCPKCNNPDTYKQDGYIICANCDYTHN